MVNYCMRISEQFSVQRYDKDEASEENPKEFTQA